MNLTTNNKALWTKLYKTADRFKKMGPWKWMYDTDLFGVKDPETGEVGYCCIMGNAGKNYALAVYRGVSGLESYMSLYENPVPIPEDPTLGIFLQDCLMVSFSDRAFLSKDELQQIKTLGFKFRGRNQWIQFQDFSPGLYPWYIEEGQIQRLIYALEQAMQVAQRYKSNDRLLDSADEPEAYLVRVSEPNKDEKGLKWRDTYEIPDWNDDVDTIPELTQAELALTEQIKAEIPQNPFVLLSTLFHLPNPVQEKGRPFYPRINLWITYESEFILHFDTLSPDDGRYKIAQIMHHVFSELEAYPSQFVVAEASSADLYQPLCEELGIELILNEEEEAFMRVKQGMMQFLPFK